MKAIIRFSQSINNKWLKGSLSLILWLSFLIFPSCQKVEDKMGTQESSEKMLLLTSDLSHNSSTAEMSILYGHKIFKRNTGTPFVETQNIENPDFNCYDGNFVLKIQNGSDKRTRVSSAEILIDGVLVASPSDFSKNVSLITKPLSGLTSGSILEVKLNSAPGSFIDLWIEGTIILITTVFEQIGPLCQNSTAPVLPLGSSNAPAINGTWNPATINTATAGKTIYTFTPAEGQCGISVTMDIEVTTPIIPAFTQIGPLLQNSTAPDLPATSTNGIPGTWNPGTINTATAGTFTFTFTPAAGQCATTTTMIIEVTNKGTVSDVEGNVYKTIKIGDQWWMAENLKTTRYSNGDLIGTTTPVTLDISSEITPKYQWASRGNEINVATYGRIYTWYVETDSRNLCPTGWHVPSDAEWTTLVNYLTNNGYGYEGSGSDIAKSMAATSGWNTDPLAGNVGNDQASNNSSSFTALPSGNRYSSGNFIVTGTFTGWCSSTEFNTINAWFRGLYSNNNSLLRSYANKKDAGPVRCIKDN